VLSRPTLSVGTKAVDGHDLLRFRCWDGDPDEPWIGDVEEYVRVLALKSAFRTLVFRDDGGEVAAVTAFDRREVRPFEAARYLVPGWHLQVVAVSLRYQGSLVENDILGCPPAMKMAEYAHRSTYRYMLEIDPARQFITARVHDENRRSIKAAARVDLERTVREDVDYWRMLGPVNPAALCRD
jgi:hypothetical protein